MQRNRSGFRVVVHALLAIYAAVLAYILLGLIFKFSVSADVFFGLSFALLFFTLGQSIFELGIKRALLFLLIASVIGFLAEVLGTNSGFPFGKYYYTDYLGAKFLGVPVVVPLVWFVIAYLCYSIVAGNTYHPLADIKTNGRALFWKIALLSAFGAVAWDLMIDPMFSSYGYWVWTGQYLSLPELDGIPLTNFVGWFALVALMVSVCLYLIPPFNPSVRHVLMKRNNTQDSVIVYILLLLDGVVANFSLRNFAVIGLGLVGMISFLVLSIRTNSGSARTKQVGQITN